MGKLFLPAVDCLAFLGAQHLLTVGRPEGLAIYFAGLLTEGVVALFSIAFLFFFGLLMGFCTVGVAKPLRYHWKYDRRRCLCSFALLSDFQKNRSIKNKKEYRQNMGKILWTVCIFYALITSLK